MIDASIQSKEISESKKLAETRTQKRSISNEKNPSKSIPSFECSDTSSDTSSDVSDDEQTENPPTEASHNVTKGDKTSNHPKHNLHTIVQEYRSPEKQTGSVTVTPVLLNRSKSRTTSGEDLHIPTSLKDLQKSLTPELKAARDRDNELASRSPSPKTRNRLYRNKKVDLQKKNSSKVGNGDKEEEPAPTLQPEDDGHDDGGGLPAVKDRQAKKTTKQKPDEAETLAVKPNKGTFVILNLLHFLNLITTGSAHLKIACIVCMISS